MQDLLFYIEKSFREILREEINLALKNYREKEETTKSELEFITVEEACKLLRISKPTLYNRMRDGSVNYKRLGGRILFDKQNLFKSNTKRYEN
jgi:excisionase family DNA binding protein